MTDDNQIVRQDSTLICLALQGVERGARITELYDWLDKATLPSTKTRIHKIICDYIETMDKSIQ